MDRGNVEQTISIVFPENSQIRSTEYEKERNPSLITINFGGMKICWRIDLRKGAVFDCDGIYCAGFDKHDLKRAFARFGAILRYVPT